MEKMEKSEILSDILQIQSRLDHWLSIRQRHEIIGLLSLSDDLDSLVKDLEEEVKLGL